MLKSTLEKNHLEWSLMKNRFSKFCFNISINTRRPFLVSRQAAIFTFINEWEKKHVLTDLVTLLEMALIRSKWPIDQESWAKWEELCFRRPKPSDSAWPIRINYFKNHYFSSKKLRKSSKNWLYFYRSFLYYDNWGNFYIPYKNSLNFY